MKNHKGKESKPQMNKTHTQIQKYPKTKKKKTNQNPKSKKPTTSKLAETKQ